jgi:hypothetical protein
MEENNKIFFQKPLFVQRFFVFECVERFVENDNLDKTSLFAYTRVRFEAPSGVAMV